MTNLAIFKTRAFWPLFLTQFFGCLNDSLIKSALIIYVTYKIEYAFGVSTASLILGIQAVFIIPFIIFASLAGELADKYEKTRIVKAVKISEIFIACFAVYGFMSNNLAILILDILLLGIHSTFFGPVKYSILPEHLSKEELVTANGFIEGGTFVGICLGGILGGIYNQYSNLVIFISLFLAVAGFVASLFIPKTHNYDPNLKVNKNIITATVSLVKYSFSNRVLLICTLGNSWFWFIGSCFISQIPLLAKVTIAGDETVTNLFMLVFSLGVGVGSAFCNYLYKGEISTRYVYLSAIGMSIFALDLSFAASSIQTSESLINMGNFLGDIYNFRILFDMFCFSALSGIYVVPFYAMMQFFSDKTHRSRVIAANNIVNSIFIVLSAVFLGILFSVQISIPNIILILACINTIVAVVIYKIAPDSSTILEEFIRVTLKFICNWLYKVEVKGLENFYSAGNRAVIIANHTSLVDAVLLAIYLPEKVLFAVNSAMAKKWWIKPVLKLAKTYSIDTHNPTSIRHLVSEVRKDQKLVIFPEGRISNTGSLMKIYEGPGIIADRADASILPIHIEGLQYTPFAYASYSRKMRWFPKVSINILPHINCTEERQISDDRERRRVLAIKVYDIMCKMSFESIDTNKHLYEAMLDAAKFYHNKPILEDISFNPMRYKQLITKSIVLGKAISKIHKIQNDDSLPIQGSQATHTQENHSSSTDKSLSQYNVVGLMLPTSIGATVVFYAMQIAGVVPALINFSSGAPTIIEGCKIASVKTIYTSKKFIEQANLQELVDTLSQNIEIKFLDDFKISMLEKIKGYLASFVAKEYFEHISSKYSNPNNPAAILFTSGTEGPPKAVALSHKNIYTNICQMSTHFDFNEQDVCLNCLPTFHSFGLMVSILMINKGVKSFLYPSPLHYKTIPELFYENNCTIMLSTDTFLNMYYKAAHAYDFHSARYIVAGAEKLRNSTKQLWLEKFGVRIIEGYGVTECSPVISCNNNMYYRSGSVGRIITGMEMKLEAVPEITEGHKLMVKGDNVMLGYVQNGKITPPVDGWYDTGDIVQVDKDGYIYLIARLKRFAKIGGEMISLPTIESLISDLDPANSHAVISALDNELREKIVMFTTNSELKLENIAAHISKAAMSNLMLPKEIIYLPEMLLFPNGKINYSGLAQFYSDQKSR